MSGKPPSLAGAVQDKVTVLLPAIAVRLVGGSGVVAASTDCIPEKVIINAVIKKANKIVFVFFKVQQFLKQLLKFVFY